MARKRSEVRTFKKRKYAYSGRVYSTKKQAEKMAQSYRAGGKFYARLVPIQYKKKKYWQVFYSPK